MTAGHGNDSMDPEASELIGAAGNWIWWLPKEPWARELPNFVEEGWQLEGPKELTELHRC